MALAKKLGLYQKTLTLFPLHWVQPSIWLVRRQSPITVLAMAAAHTQGITVGFATALLEPGGCESRDVARVAGGSFADSFLACSLFGIDNDVAMQVLLSASLSGMSRLCRNCVEAAHEKTKSKIASLVVTVGDMTRAKTPKSEN